ncbi:hypothetical protein [Methylovulum miyakonense]|uniref:hypothetical protein n=1 Tax=Methylovulum miyakonense TaxID=645578 RepID=UPI00035EFE91|nr:hypothetical protein [Methylovulum miyakonense]
MKLDNLLSGNTEAIKNLPIEKRATIISGLPDELKIKDIAKLAFPDDEEKQESFRLLLIGLCKSGRLKFYGDIKGWEYWDNMPNPYPKSDGDYPLMFVGDYYTPEKLYAYPDDCLIHKDNFETYLKNKQLWPIDGLLANWWANEKIFESKPDAESQNKNDIETGTQRKNDFLNFLRRIQPDIDDTLIMNTTKENAFNQVKQANPELWNIEFGYFNRFFWQEFSANTGIKGQPGRGKNK